MGLVPVPVYETGLLFGGFLALSVVMTVGLYTVVGSAEVYHKLPTDYSEAIGYRGEPPGEKTVEDYRPDMELTQRLSDPDELDVLDMDDKAEEVEPEVVWDFAEGEKYFRGERPIWKYLRLCLYTGVLNVFAVFVVILSLVFTPTQIRNVTDPVWFILGIVLVITLMQTVTRILSFSRYYPGKRSQQRSIRDALYNFEFSFLVSVYYLWAVSASILLLTRNGNRITLPITASTAGEIVAGLVAITMLGCLVSELVLFLGVRDGDKEDFTRKDPDIKGCDGD